MLIFQRRRMMAAAVALLLVLMQMIPVISNAESEEFDVDGKTLVKYNGDSQVVRLPDGITSIGEGAFAGNKKIVSVHMPSQLETVGAKAFDKCENLSYVEMNENLKIIKESAFRGCKNLRYVMLPDGLTDIEERAFDSSGIEFVKMPNSLKKIGNKAYFNSKVKAVSLNEGLISIGDGAFETCYSLYGLAVPESVLSVGKNVTGDNGSKFKWLLFKNDSTDIPNTPTDQMEITYYGGEPSSVQAVYQAVYDKNNTTKLKFANKDTFKMAAALSVAEDTITVEAGKNKSIVVTTDFSDVTDSRLAYVSEKQNIAGVNESGEITGIKVGKSKVFVISAQGSVASVDVDVVTPQGKEFEISADGVLSAYYGHEVEITIPDEATSIGENAFIDDNNIQKVNMGKNVSSIGNNAFSNCSALKEVNMSNAKALSNIGKAAFYKCVKLERIQIPANVENIGEEAFYGCTGLKNIRFDEGSGVKVLSKSCFAGCQNLESVNIPEECITIGDSAFASDFKLTDIQFNSKLTKIGKYAFASAKELKAVAVPEGVVTIGREAFYGNTDLESITLPSTFTEIDGATIFGFIFDNKDTVNGGHLKKIEIAQGNPKYKSDNGMVYEGNTLVYIPQGVENAVVADGTKEIGKYAAIVHTNLKSVTMPSGLVKIGESAFGNCEGLESVKMPDTLEEIESGAFLGCEECTELSIPKNVNKIGKLAFYELENLREIVIPDGVTVIEQYAVAGNDNMQHLTLPRNLVEVARNGCSFYPNLEELYLPEKLEKIGAQGFAAYHSVQHLELPASLTEIGSEAFKNMDSLKSVYIHGNAKIPADLFLDVKSPKVYVFSHNADDSIKSIIKAPEYELIDMIYEKKANRKVELQGLENILNDKNHNKVFTVNITEEQGKVKEDIRLKVDVQEDGKEMLVPYGTMKLVVELNPEQEDKQYYVYKEKDGKYTELTNKRVHRFIATDLSEFGNVVVSQHRLAETHSGHSGKKSGTSSALKPVVMPKPEEPAATSSILGRFTDVSEGQWYAKDLETAIKKGLIKGTSENTFSPEKNVTGKEMITMLVRSMGKEPKSSSSADWYEGYKNEAALLKLDDGIKFDVSKDLTRAEVAFLMYNYVKINGKQKEGINLSVLDSVKDADQISAEYREAVAYMYQKGLLKGYEDGSFGANKMVARKEIAVILVRLLNV